MKNISAKQLHELILQEQAIIIDVRELFEHKSCHINGSVLISSSNFDEAKIPQVENKKIIFHCKSGRRSESVLKKLTNQNYYNLEGGIDAWIAAGFDVVQSEKQHLPLDRQVQLAIGVILIASVVLIYFVKINFVLIPLIIGIGLSVAGLTGFCGLAMVLAKAPWNKTFHNQKVTSCSIKKAS